MLEQNAVFDNGLPNIGYTLVFENGAVISSLRALVFGASLSYPILKYLKRLFARSVSFHSVAQIDVAVINHEKLDVLL